MKPNLKLLSIAMTTALMLTACKKNENSMADQAIEAASTNNDNISMAATQEIEGKKFVKTASVNMEVKDVYDATINIEKTLKEIGGYVLKSNMVANTISENTYNTSEENAVLIRKYKNENMMEVKVPTEYLGDFLTAINNQKLFLNTRIINAEDVTSNIKMAELEGNRTAKKQQQITSLKPSKAKVQLDDENEKQKIDQTIGQLNLSDNIKYSLVTITITEPQTSIAKIPISNLQNIDNQYKVNFVYDLKNAVIKGYYIIQEIIIFLVTIWPIVIITAIIIYFLRKRKLQINKEI